MSKNMTRREWRILQLEQDEHDLVTVLHFSQTDMKRNGLKPSDMERYRRRLVYTRNQLKQERAQQGHKRFTFHRH
jgi:hypothetical protein